MDECGCPGAAVAGRCRSASAASAGALALATAEVQAGECAVQRPVQQQGAHRATSYRFHHPKGKEVPGSATPIG